MSTFVTDSKKGLDTAFVDADEVALAFIVDEGVSLLIKGTPTPVTIPCNAVQAARTLALIADSTSAFQIDRKALTTGGVPTLVTRADIYQAGRRKKRDEDPAMTKQPVSAGAAVAVANAKLLQLCDAGYTIKAIKACRECSGVSLKDAKDKVDSLRMTGTCEWKPDEARNINVSVFDSYFSVRKSG